MHSMVDIPAGTIALRDDRLGTRWQVSIAPFRLARYPVVGHDDVPLTNISWYDAVALCNKLSADDGLPPAYEISGEEVNCLSSPGYRLPTDAEWQYACTAGVPAYRYGPSDDIAWYADNSDDHVHPVGQKSPNPWGLHDMLGNIWEWCWDLYDPATYGAYRIFRGAGFADAARSVGTTVRRRSHPTYAIEDLVACRCLALEGLVGRFGVGRSSFPSAGQDCCRGVAGEASGQVDRDGS